MYDIESRTDLSGVTLIVRFPEADLDRKALYTIQADLPEFLVPFRFRSIDGQAECSYQLESRSKLQYRYGTRSPKEYVEFWGQILQPLLDCGDWFLKPMSFVLDPQYLYVDRNGTICYLYIPTRQDCVAYHALQGMVTELSRQNTVTDPALENQVLRAIMQDFQPKAFLQMLREYQGKQSPQEEKPQSAPSVTSAIASVLAGGAAVIQQAQNQAAQTQLQSQPLPPEQPPVNRTPEQPPAPVASPMGGVDDIVINLGGAESSASEKPQKKGGLFGGKKEKKPAEPKPAKKGGLFGGKKEKKSKEILLGAAAEQPQQPDQPVYADPPAQVWTPPVEDGLTELDEESSGPCLRLCSTAVLPDRIPVAIQEGQAFTIGRFDVTVGRKQSDFEFDGHTKAVSRRHAAIERDEGGYCIVDLSSKAGTFVNGERLTPNVPKRLSRGSRVCFGTSGADYLWEE